MMKLRFVIFMMAGFLFFVGCGDDYLGDGNNANQSDSASPNGDSSSEGITADSGNETNDTSGTKDSSDDSGASKDSGTSEDTGSPDTGSPDTGSPDTGSPDTGSPDTGSPDDSESNLDPLEIIGTYSIVNKNDQLEITSTIWKQTMNDGKVKKYDIVSYNNAETYVITKNPNGKYQRFDWVSSSYDTSFCEIVRSANSEAEAKANDTAVFPPWDTGCGGKKWITYNNGI